MKHLIVTLLLMSSVVLPLGCSAGAPASQVPTTPAIPTYAFGSPERKAICNAPEGGIYLFSDADCQQPTDKVLTNGAAVEMLESAPMCSPVGVGDKRSTPSAYYTGYIPRWYLCFSGTMPPPSTYDPWTSGCLFYILVPAIWGVFLMFVAKKVKAGNLNWGLGLAYLVVLLPAACVLAYVIAFPGCYLVTMVKDGW